MDNRDELQKIGANPKWKFHRKPWPSTHSVFDLCCAHSWAFCVSKSISNSLAGVSGRPLSTGSGVSGLSWVSWAVKYMHDTRCVQESKSPCRNWTKKRHLWWPGGPNCCLTWNSNVHDSKASRDLDECDLSLALALLSHSSSLPLYCRLLTESYFAQKSSCW